MKTIKIIEKLDNPFLYVRAMRKSNRRNNLIKKNISKFIKKSVNCFIFEMNHFHYISYIFLYYISMNFIIIYYYLNVLVTPKTIHINNPVYFLVNRVYEKVNPVLNVQMEVFVS